MQVINSLYDVVKRKIVVMKKMVEFLNIIFGEAHPERGKMFYTKEKSAEVMSLSHRPIKNCAQNSGMFFQHTQKAFTLPEIIVAMAVLLLTIVASTNLLVSIIRSNNENAHSLVAYQLAQEGLEAMRNIRDSNWLLGADFKGTIDQNNIWTEILPETPGVSKYYVIDFNQLGDQIGAIAEPSALVQASEIYNYAPWKLSELQVNQNQLDLTKAALYLHKVVDPANPDRDQIRYIPNGIGNDEKSLFSRYVKIEALGYDRNGQVDDSKVYKYRVTAVVTWKEQMRDKEVRLITELTDWKGGSL